MKSKQPEPKAPAQWNLGGLISIEATMLVRDEHDAIGRLFLGLALAFNDLKGLVLLQSYLEAMGAPAEAYSPYYGQWNGMQAQITRWMCGVMHEVLELIGAPQYRQVLESAEFELIVASLPQSSREAWDTLRASTNAPTNKPGPSGLLVRIRNNAAFHFGNKGTALADAYLGHFVDGAAKARSETNSAAKFSVGKDMDATRFYYADAAAQRVVLDQLELAALPIAKITELVCTTNVALANLVGAFIAHRRPA